MDALVWTDVPSQEALEIHQTQQLHLPRVSWCLQGLLQGGAVSPASFMLFSLFV